MKRAHKLFSMLALALLTSASLTAQDTDPFPEVNTNQYSLTMTVTGYVRLDEVKLTKDDGIVVAAYHGDEIRGKATLEDFNNGKYKDLLMMTVYGETAGESLYFKVYRGGYFYKVDQNLTFQSNENVGSPLKPYYIDLKKPLIPLGDANDDGVVDIADAIAIANHIIGKPNEKFVIDAADVNVDGTISIADAAGIINMILP